MGSDLVATGGDDFTFTVKNCAYRTGSYVYAKSKVSWNMPSYYVGRSYTFDGAKIRVYLKKPRDGKDLILEQKTVDIESKMELHSNSYGNGDYTTDAIYYYNGSSTAARYGDGALKIDWSDDGAGYQHYSYRGSPRV